MCASVPIQLMKGSVRLQWQMRVALIPVRSGKPGGQLYFAAGTASVDLASWYARSQAERVEHGVSPVHAGWQEITSTGHIADSYCPRIALENGRLQSDAHSQKHNRTQTTSQSNATSKNTTLARTRLKGHGKTNQLLAKQLNQRWEPFAMQLLETIAHLCAFYF